MSNAGLENWKRDYPVKERALLILRRLVSAIDNADDGVKFPTAVWEAHAEAPLLIQEVKSE